MKKSFLLVLLASASASANPRPLPFTYPYVTLPEGSLEMEQFVDLSPVRVAREAEDGTLEAIKEIGYKLTTELEYAVTDRLEIALYFAWGQEASADSTHLVFDGIKQRVRYRFGDVGEWPVDVGVYAELAELHDEIELEEKLILSRNFGAVTVGANLWIEQEYVIAEEKLEYIYNPTIGFHYDVRPFASLGLEYWVRGNFESEEGPAVHYAGPTALLQASKAWIAVGAYARLDNLGDAPIVDDQYGKLYVRVIAGIDL